MVAEAPSAAAVEAAAAEAALRKNLQLLNIPLRKILQLLNTPLYMLEELLPLRYKKPLTVKKPRSSGLHRAPIPDLIYLGDPDDISPAELFFRLVNAKERTMPTAMRGGEYLHVIELGKLAGRDLALFRSVMTKNGRGKLWMIECAIDNMMGHAFSMLQDWTAAAEHFERLVESYKTAEERGFLSTFVASTEALMNVGTTNLRLAKFDEAKAVFEKVRRVGVREGCFASESKACEGLSRWAFLVGQHADAKEYSLQVRPNPKP